MSAAGVADQRAEWADTSGTMLCGIYQSDYVRPRTWTFAVECIHTKAMLAKSNARMCRVNTWSGPVVGPMGGRWSCSTEPVANPLVSTREDNTGLWWLDQVRGAVVRGRYGFAKGGYYYALPVGARISVGNITCTQGSAAVSCDDRKTRTGFTVTSAGKFTWRGVKGKVRTHGDTSA